MGMHRLLQGIPTRDETIHETDRDRAGRSLMERVYWRFLVFWGWVSVYEANNECEL